MTVHQPTQKLFYNRFTHCVKLGLINDRSSYLKLGDSRIADIKRWLGDNGVVHRTRMEWRHIKIKNRNVDITLGIYFNEETALDYLIQNYSTMIKLINKPINDSHRDMLLNRTEIEFREKLYFKNFRYKIVFNPHTRHARAELFDTVREMLVDKQHGRSLDYVIINNWSPALYIKNDEDLILFKLSLSDIIRKVIRVELFEDHGMVLDNNP